MKISRTVVLGGLAAALGASLEACATPAREPQPQSDSSASAAARPDSVTASADPPAPALGGAAPSAVAQTPPKTGSAYFGCGVPIPAGQLWDETSESQVFEAIADAKRCAAEHGRRLMLEFVAPWCDDCREMARLEEAEQVDRLLRQRFERVRINVGKWDRHEALRASYGVKALATYIVIDPKTSKQLVKTTLEPITNSHGKKLTAEAWAAWLERN